MRRGDAMPARAPMSKPAIRLLLTRPQAQARALAAQLRARGFAPLLCPMLDLVFLERRPPRLSPTAALAFTSANGVEALKRSMARPLWREACARRVFAVGEATAAAARAAGFRHIVEADGDAQALAAQLVRAAPPDVAHISGRAGAGALARHVRAYIMSAHTDIDARTYIDARTHIMPVRTHILPAHIHVRTHILYDTRPRRALPPAIVRQVLGGRVDGALFFSARTARAFRTAVHAHAQAVALKQALSGVAAFCLAPAAARPLGKLMPIHIAGAHTSAALLQAVAAHTAHTARACIARRKRAL